VRWLLLFVVLAGALVVVVAPYFVLPAVLENLVAREAQDRLGLSEKPAVNLDSDPQWRMLLGEFSRGRISTGETDLGRVSAEDATLALDPFSVDVGESARTGTLVPREPLSGDVQFRIAEAEITRLARQNAQVPVNEVELGGGGVTVNSEVSLLGTTLPVTVDGDVGVEGGDLAFRPEGLRAGGTRVPDAIAGTLLDETAFRHPVDGLPGGGAITGARTVDGAVVLTGRLDRIPLGRGG
jgi:hypothetical protein